MNYLRSLFPPLVFGCECSSLVDSEVETAEPAACEPWGGPPACLEEAISSADETGACTEADANRVYKLPAGELGLNFGITAGFVGDLDGDGVDEVTLPVPGRISIDEYSLEKWTFQFPIVHRLYHSSARCSSDRVVSGGDYDASVATSAGVVGLTSYADLHSMTYLLGVGDLDGDGRSEVAQLDYTSGEGGWAAVFGGAGLVSGSALGPDDRLGAVLPDGADEPLTEIANPGDVDGDGVNDLLVGGLATRVYSGTSMVGAELDADRFLVELPFGRALAGSGGDVDGDGLRDVALTLETAESLQFEVAVWFADDFVGVGATSPEAGAVISETSEERPWLDLDADGDGRNDLLLVRGVSGEEDDESAYGEVSVFLGSQLDGEGELGAAHFRLQASYAGGIALADARPVGRGDVLYRIDGGLGDDVDVGFRFVFHDQLAAGGVAAPAANALLVDEPVFDERFPAIGDANGDGSLDILGTTPAYLPTVFLVP